MNSNNLSINLKKLDEQYNKINERLDELCRKLKEINK